MSRPLLLLLLILLLSSSLRPAGSARGEAEALLRWKASLLAPADALASWSPNGSAVGAAAPCAWRGVSCDSRGRVVALDVAGAGLAGTLAPSLARLPALESISLFGNRLAGGVPPGLRALAPTLRKLNLSRNALAGEIPPFLGAFPWLRLLDLSYNAFAGEIPAALFDPCLRLRYVSLAHNNLTGPVPVFPTRTFK